MLNTSKYFVLVDKKAANFWCFGLCYHLILLGFHAIFPLFFAKIQNNIVICKFIGEKAQIVESLGNNGFLPRENLLPA